MLRPIFTFTFIILGSIICCDVSVVEVYWNVSHILASCDGCAPWPVIAANGSPHIPPVHVQQGDILKLTVLNSLENATSIHIQGSKFNGASYLDGTSMISKCGIPLGESYTYVFDTHDYSGIFWLMCRTKYHTAYGLHTLLIVYEPPGKSVVHYDKEIFFTFEYWGEETFLYHYNKQDVVKTSELLPYYPDGLINSINGNITQSVKLRIATIITAHNTNEFNYIYNVAMYASSIVPNNKLNPRHYEGLIEYNSNAPVKTFPSPDDTKLQWQDDILLQPLNKQLLLSKDGHSIVLKERTFTVGYGLPCFALGNVSYTPPLVPSLFSALSMGDLALDARTYGPHSNAQLLKYMHVVEITIHCPSKKRLCFSHPRTFCSDRLVWSLKRSSFCAVEKINQLAHRGLAITLAEVPDVLQKQQAIPQDLINMCLSQGIKVTGNAAGNQGFNLTGLPPAVYMEDD
ncbi:Cupredoxin [Coemansia mojavensis]|nr:Cupredoxin [Coemansia mojavensis]